MKNLLALADSKENEMTLFRKKEVVLEFESISSMKEIFWRQKSIAF